MELEGTYEGYRITNRKGITCFNKFVVIIYSNSNVNLKTTITKLSGDLLYLNKAYYLQANNESKDYRLSFVLNNFNSNKSILFGVYSTVTKNKSITGRALLVRSTNLSYSLLNPIEIEINQIESIEEYISPNKNIKINAIKLQAFFDDNNTSEKWNQLLDAKDEQNDSVVNIEKEIEEIKEKQNKIIKGLSNSQINLGDIRELRFGLKEMLSNNRKREVIEILFEKFKEKVNVESIDELFLIKENHNRIEKEILRGTIQKDEAEMILSRINYRLIKMINMVN